MASTTERLNIVESRLEEMEKKHDALVKMMAQDKGTAKRKHYSNVGDLSSNNAVNVKNISPKNTGIAFVDSRGERHLVGPGQTVQAVGTTAQMTRQVAKGNLQITDA